MAGPTETQPQWYGSTNPDVLLTIIRERLASGVGRPIEAPGLARRYQLLICACARMGWDLLPADARHAVLVRERFAEGRASETDLPPALRITWGAVTARQHALNATTGPPESAARSAAKALATRAAGRAPLGGNPVAEGWQGVWNRVYFTAREHQAELIRDIFPPPGYSPALRPDWRTSTVVALARQMDETGEFGALPILADALQDAGCDDEVMLGRCRAPAGVHCRGNWVVDLVLGRE